MTKPKGTWVAYVAPFAFPEGGAAARRVLGNAQSLVAAGYDVTVISAQIDRSGNDSRAFAPGISVASTGERDAEHLPRALKRARYAFMGSRTRKWIMAQPEAPAAVILYSGYTPYLLNLSGMCRRRGLPLIFDAVEWYTADSAAEFLTSPYLWNIELAMRLLVPRLDGVIAISSYLAEYYQAKGLPVAQVPPTLDPSALVPNYVPRALGNPMRLAYCGSAVYDQLDVIISALMQLNRDSERIILEIAGPSADEVMALPSLCGVRERPAGLVVHGRVPHEQSASIIRSADFSIFLRKINRVSNAGFPTKFAESMTVGTPVLTNLTSDLAYHLLDGKNGLVCASPKPSDVLTCLRRALELDPNQLCEMRRAARSTAEAHFDYMAHANTLAEFLAQCNVTGKKRTKQENAINAQ